MSVYVYILYIFIRTRSTIFVTVYISVSSLFSRPQNQAFHGHGPVTGFEPAHQGHYSPVTLPGALTIRPADMDCLVYFVVFLTPLILYIVLNFVDLIDVKTACEWWNECIQMHNHRVVHIHTHVLVINHCDIFSATGQSHTYSKVVSFHP